MGDNVFYQAAAGAHFSRTGAGGESAVARESSFAEYFERGADSIAHERDGPLSFAVLEIENKISGKIISARQVTLASHGFYALVRRWPDDAFH